MVWEGRVCTDPAALRITVLLRLPGGDVGPYVGRAAVKPTEPPPIPITVNGEPREVAAGSTVASLLAELGLGQQPVAVERNRRLVRRPEHATTGLQAGDQLELVTFFGGG